MICVFLCFIVFFCTFCSLILGSINEEQRVIIFLHFGFVSTSRAVLFVLFKGELV